MGLKDSAQDQPRGHGCIFTFVQIISGFMMRQLLLGMLWCLALPGQAWAQPAGAAVVVEPQANVLRYDQLRELRHAS